MKDDKDRSEAKNHSRRQLLQRLGLGAAVATLAYGSPLLLDLSEASASRGSWGSRGRRRGRGSRGRPFHHHHHYHHHYRSRGSWGRGRRGSRRRRRPEGGDVHLWIRMKDVF